METEQYLAAFLAETEENLDALNEHCLALERSGADDDIFAAMFRAAHTLKGMSATMGFSKMADLTHHMEDALGYVREHPEVFDEPIVDTLFEAIDALTQHFELIQGGGEESAIDHTQILQKLASILRNDGTQATAATAQSVSFEPHVMALIEQLRAEQEVGFLQVELSPACVMKGVRMIMVMRALEEGGSCIGTIPDAKTLEEGSFEGPAYFAVIPPDGDMERLQSTVADISEVAAVHIVDWPLAGTAGAAPTAAAAVQAPTKRPERAAINPPEAGSPAAAKSAAPSPSGRLREQTLRVPISRIDDFMNVLSELVIARTRLDLLARELDDSALMEVSERIARLSDDLQDGVMNMRMMPVESLFQRFPRMMRDLQKSLDREFDFEMSGMETEMDRTVMDEMGEALVHLLRNAVDHGLESPAAREQAGKPRRGVVRLSAYAAGGHVYLEVADDGGGIHRDQVLKKAIERHIVDATAASRMSDEQVYELLFASGFSTAQTVSDISGRGVGLDAVRGKVESLGGSVRIESEVGKGTTFIIELPLTLTIMQAMLVKVNDELFAIPTSSVEEVARLDADSFDAVQEQPVLRYREKVVPVLNLGEHFFAQTAAADGLQQMVICRDGRRYLALVVDDVIDELEIVNKPLGKYLEHAKLFSGATFLGDGHVALIVDVHQFFQATA